MDESIQTITSSLLSRARARDERAWEELVDLYGPLVYSWCLRKGLKREQAEDVGQEVFLAVSRNLATYEHASFRGWLRTITDRKIIDFWERNLPAAEGGTEGQQRMNGVAAPADSSESAECEHQDNKIMQLSLLDFIRSEFSDQDVLAFCRLVIDEKTPAEVAEELKISRNKVYLAKSRILHRLRAKAARSNNP